MRDGVVPVDAQRHQHVRRRVRDQRLSRKMLFEGYLHSPTF
jgi:hypothetical protein